MNTDGLSFKMQKTFLITGEGISESLKDMATMVTRKLMMEILEEYQNFSKEDLKKTYGEYLRKVTRYTLEQLVDFQSGELEKLFEWNYQVVSFYVVRMLLLKKPIPVVDSFCTFCKESGKPLQKCRGCKSMYYCSPECQKSHWKIHKANCCHVANLNA